MSRVISSSPSFVERASISYSWMWIEESTSSLTRRSLSDDRVLEVVALERHEGDEQVRAERELAVAGRRPVGQHLVRLHALTEADDRLLVDERALVRPHELRQRVVVLAVLRLDDDRLGVDVDDLAGGLGRR